MHFNQLFSNNNSGTVFNNGYGYVYNPIFNPPPINNGFYPHAVIGEGDVSCVTLPDGTCQFYFTPSANWRPSNNYPTYNQVNPNNGTWFVRTITTPIPAVWNNPPCLRQEAPVPYQSLDCDMGSLDNGFQLKFHNDKWTSTTDIHYFYPCLRQIDCTLTFPSKGYAAIQVDTPMVTETTSYKEVMSQKPCYCTSNPPPNTRPKDVADCQCALPSKFKRTTSTTSLQRLHLLPKDTTKTRIKFERKTSRSSKPNNKICECDKPTSSKSETRSASKGRERKVSGDRGPVMCEREIQDTIEVTPPECICICKPPPSSDKETQEIIKMKSQAVICDCDRPTPTLTEDKSSGLRASGCDINKGKCPCSNKQKPSTRVKPFVGKQPEKWCPRTESIQALFGMDKSDSEAACCSSRYR